MPVHFIQGNCEVSVLAHMNGKPQHNLPDQVREGIAWTANQLLPEHQKIISSWPIIIQLNIEELGAVLFCHATPRNRNENFTRLTPCINSVQSLKCFRQVQWFADIRTCNSKE